MIGIDLGNWGIGYLFCKDELLKVFFLLFYVCLVFIIIGFLMYFNYEFLEEIDGLLGVVVLVVFL